MALKRVFAGFYTRYDGKPIFVVRVLKDIDTGESIVVCKDASFSKEDNEHCYLIRYTSFCEQVEVDGVCPFGINDGIDVYLDESLKRYDTVYPAAGDDHSAVKLTIPELEAVSGAAGWVDVCKDEQGEVK